MKAVCHTDPAKPFKSLTKGISYPEAFSFTIKATSWGCPPGSRNHWRGLKDDAVTNNLLHLNLLIA